MPSADYEFIIDYSQPEKEFVKLTKLEEQFLKLSKDTLEKKEAFQKVSAKTTVKIAKETSKQLEKALKDRNKKAIDIEKEHIEARKRGLKELREATKTLTGQELAKVKERIKEEQRLIEKHKLKVLRLNRELSISLTDLQLATQKKVKVSFQESERAAKTFAGKFKATMARLKQTFTLDKMVDRFARRLEKAFHWRAINAGMRNVFNMSTKLVKNAIGEFRKLDKGAREVLTLLEETGVEQLGGLKGIKELGTDISKTFGQDITTSLKSMYQALSSSVPAESLESFSNIIGKLATGGITTMEQATDGVTSLVNAYSDLTFKEEDLLRVTDVLFQGMKAGKTTITELSQNLGKVAPLAAQMGVSLEEVVAATSAITTVGVKTSQATTQITGVLTNIIKPSQRARKIFKELGITYGETALQGTTFSDWLTNTIKKLRDNNVEIGDVFSKVNSLRGAITLTGAAGQKFSDILGDMAENAKNVGSTTETAFKKMQEGADFQLRQLEQKFKAMLASLGESIFPALSSLFEVIDILKPALTALGNIIKTILEASKPFLDFINGIVVAVEGMIDPVGVASQNVDKLAVSVANLTKQLQALTEIEFTKEIIEDETALTEILSKLNLVAPDTAKALQDIADSTLDADDKLKLMNQTLHQTTEEIKQLSEEEQKEYLKNFAIKNSEAIEQLAVIQEEIKNLQIKRADKNQIISDEEIVRLETLQREFSKLKNQFVAQAEGLTAIGIDPDLVASQMGDLMGTVFNQIAQTAGNSWEILSEDLRGQILQTTQTVFGELAEQQGLLITENEQTIKQQKVLSEFEKERIKTNKAITEAQEAQGEEAKKLLETRRKEIEILRSELIQKLASDDDFKTMLSPETYEAITNMLEESLQGIDDLIKPISEAIDPEKNTQVIANSYENLSVFLNNLWKETVDENQDITLNELDDTISTVENRYKAHLDWIENNEKLTQQEVADLTLQEQQTLYNTIETMIRGVSDLTTGREEAEGQILQILNDEGLTMEQQQEQAIAIIDAENARFDAIKRTIQAQIKSIQVEIENQKIIKDGIKSRIVDEQARITITLKAINDLSKIFEKNRQDVAGALLSPEQEAQAKILSEQYIVLSTQISDSTAEIYTLDQSILALTTTQKGYKTLLSEIGTEQDKFGTFVQVNVKDFKDFNSVVDDAKETVKTFDDFLLSSQNSIVNKIIGVTKTFSKSLEKLAKDGTGSLGNLVKAFERNMTGITDNIFDSMVGKYDDITDASEGMLDNVQGDIEDVTEAISFLQSGLDQLAPDDANLRDAIQEMEKNIGGLSAILTELQAKESEIQKERTRLANILEKTLDIEKFIKDNEELVNVTLSDISNFHKEITTKLANASILGVEAIENFTKKANDVTTDLLNQAIANYDNVLDKIQENSVSALSEITSTINEIATFRSKFIQNMTETDAEILDTYLESLIESKEGILEFFTTTTEEFSKSAERLSLKFLDPKEFEIQEGIQGVNDEFKEVEETAKALLDTYMELSSLTDEQLETQGFTRDEVEKALEMVLVRTESLTQAKQIALDNLVIAQAETDEFDDQLERQKAIIDLRLKEFELSQARLKLELTAKGEFDRVKELEMELDLLQKKFELNELIVIQDTTSIQEEIENARRIFDDLKARREEGEVVDDDVINEAAAKVDELEEKLETINKNNTTTLLERTQLQQDILDTQLALEDARIEKTQERIDKDREALEEKHNEIELVMRLRGLEDGSLEHLDLKIKQQKEYLEHLNIEEHGVEAVFEATEELKRLEDERLQLVQDQNQEILETISLVAGMFEDGKIETEEFLGVLDQLITQALESIPIVGGALSAAFDLIKVGVTAIINAITKKVKDAIQVRLDTMFENASKRSAELNMMLETQNKFLQRAKDLHLDILDTVKEEFEFVKKMAEDLAVGLGLGENIFDIDSEQLLEDVEFFETKIEQFNQALEELNEIDWGKWFDDSDDIWFKKWEGILNEMGFTWEEFTKGLYDKEQIQAAIEQYIQGVLQPEIDNREQLIKLLSELPELAKQVIEERTKALQLQAELSGNTIEGINAEIESVKLLLQHKEDLNLSLVEELELKLRLAQLLEDRINAEFDLKEAVLDLAGDTLGLIDNEIARIEKLLRKKDKLHLSDEEELKLQKELQDLYNERFDTQQDLLSKETELIVKKAQLEGKSALEIKAFQLKALDEQIALQEEQVALYGDDIDAQIDLVDLQLERLALEEEINNVLGDQGILYNKNIRTALKGIAEARSQGQDITDTLNAAISILKQEGLTASQISALTGASISDIEATSLLLPTTPEEEIVTPEDEDTIPSEDLLDQTVLGDSVTNPLYVELAKYDEMITEMRITNSILVQIRDQSVAGVTQPPPEGGILDGGEIPSDSFVEQTFANGQLENFNGNKI